MNSRLFTLFLALMLALGAAAGAFSQTRPRPTPPKPKPLAVVRIAAGNSPSVEPQNLTPAEQRRYEAFKTVWSTIRDTFFDKTFSGLNWDAVRREYQPRAIKAANDAALHGLLQEMINKLNRSHLTIIPPEVFVEMEKAKEQVRERFAARGNAADEDEEDEGGDTTVDPLDGSIFSDEESNFGIGVEIRMIDGQIVITNVQKDSSAERAGLRPGFVIEKVNGVSLKTLYQSVLFSGAYGKFAEKMFPLEVLSFFINGDSDTKVQLSFLNEKDEAKEAAISREKLNGKMIKAVPNFPKEFFSFESRALNADTGYVKFNMFALPAIDGICKALGEFKDKKTVVIDLRGNIGGSIGVLIGITSLLVDKPTLLGKQIYKYHSEDIAVAPQGRKYGGRLVVLIDSMSHSAAEIFAGGLQEDGRVTVVGEKSAGEALPATIKKLSTGALFMYPIANFQTPKGKFIEGRGVEPDVNIRRERKMLLTGKDSQLEAAINIANTAAATISAVTKPAPPPPAPKLPASLLNPRTTTKKIEAAKLEKKYDPLAMQAIEAHIAAAGGKEALSKLSSYSARGSVELVRAGESIHGAIELYGRTPDRFAELMKIDPIGSFNGMFDGKKYYFQSDTIGNSETDDERQVREFSLFSDLQELLKAREIYQQIIYLGEYQRKGKPAILVKALTNDGVDIAFAFDRESKLLVQRVGAVTNSSFDDYRRVGDVKVPFWQTRSDAMVLKLAEFKINAALEDSIFAPRDNCFTPQK